MADLSGLTVLKILAEDSQYINEDREKMFHNIKAELQKRPSLFVSLYRLSPRQFDELLKLIQPHLPPRVRYPGLDLSITLRYLCSKDNICKYSLLFRVTKERRCEIVPEVCIAIAHALWPLVSITLNEGYLERSAINFKKYWNFPNCVGAIDGRRIPCQTRGNGESSNYELHLLAVCDAYCRFTEFHFSEKDRKPVQQKFLKCTYLRFMEKARVQFQPEMNRDIPFVFVAGSLDYSNNCIMQAFHGNVVDKDEVIFNYHHTVAMNAADTAFGILINHWEIFQSPMIGDFFEVSGRITCLLLLHNWLINQEKELPPTSKVYMPKFILHDGDEEGIYVRGCRAMRSTTESAKRLKSTTKVVNMTCEGKITRRQFLEYFVNESPMPSSSRDHTGRIPEETPCGDVAQDSEMCPPPAENPQSVKPTDSFVRHMLILCLFAIIILILMYV